MSIVLHATSIVEPTSRIWMQVYCEGRVGLILQSGDKDKGRMALEEFVSVLEKFHPKTVAEFREKIEHIVAQYSIEDDNFCLGVLTIVNAKSFFYTNGASVILSRGKKTAMLLEDSGVISGPLQRNDRFFLVNKQGLANVDLARTRELLNSKLKVEAIVEELLLQMHQRHDNSAIVGLIVEARSGKQTVAANIDSYFLPSLSRLNIADALFTVAYWIRTAVLRLVRDGARTASQPWYPILRPCGRTSRTRVQHSANSPPRLHTGYSWYWDRRTWLVLGLIIVAVFLLNQVKSSDKDSYRLSEKLELAKHKYEEGQALIELNRLRARNVLLESKTALEELRKTLKKGEKEYEKVSELLMGVEQALKDARSAYKVQPDLFFDLSLLRDGLTANLMKQAGDSVFLLSPSRRLMAMVDLKTKASKVVAGKDWFANISQLAVVTDKQYVLSPAGITEITLHELTVIEMDKEWGEVKDLEYFEGSLYLLDGKGFIWKYIPTEDGFTSKRNFLKGDLRLQNPYSMAIDGAVWVIADRQVLKFIAGRRDSFYVRGLEEPLGTEAQIFKTAELDNLYILDKQNNRIVVLGEDGMYKAQYVWEDLNQVSDFVVSEEIGRIYLLKQDKIYSFALQ